MMKTKRWYFLTITTLLLAAAALVALALLGSGSPAVAAPAQMAAAAIPGEAMAPLPEAICNVDTAVTPNVRTCELWAKTGSLTMPDGVSVPIWGFAVSGSDTDAASVPGPLIRTNVTETLQVVLHNEIAAETVALAFPGQELIPDLDGVPAGGSATYSFTPATAGTFLYEAGLTPGGARQVAMGLFGALVVEPSPQTFEQEAILVFSEVDPAFNADPLSFSMFHFRPKYWLINGQAYPDTGYIPVAAGSTLLLRYLNAGVQDRTIGLLGLDQQVVAADGDALDFPHGAVAEPLAPGETKEALVTVPQAPDGTLYPLYNASLHQHNNNQRLVADGRAAFGGMLTFLHVSGEPPTTEAGPVASNVAVTPQKTNGTEDVTLSATFTDADADVTAYEYYVDQPGTLAGTVTVDSPASSVDVTVNFPAADVNTLASGDHVFYIRGQDANGNWGAPGSAVLNLDKAGPNISGLSLTPNPTNGGVDVLLSATADDRATGNSAVVAAEYSLDGGTTWLPMTLSASGTSVKALSATILAADVYGLGEGSHAVSVQAWDEWDNPSDVPGVINLVVDMTGPDVPTVTLNPDTLDFNQPLPVTAVRLTATVEDALTTLVNAQGFIDVVGDPGTGFDLYPADGLFDETIEDVYYDIPTSHFATLSDGTHTVYVSGLDKAGNWTPAGSEGSATIEIIAATVDNEGPTVSDLLITPDKGNKILLTGLATDSQTPIARVDWYLDTDPTTTFLMSASDGAFDELQEEVEATINANKWPSGTVIWVVAMDGKGNWGEPVSITY